jgi:hypothetical protein
MTDHIWRPSACWIRAAASQTCHPFAVLGSRPDHQEFFHGASYVQRLRDQEDATAAVIVHELTKVPRHRSKVV